LFQASLLARRELGANTGNLLQLFGVFM